jgi:hypothetical protein
MDVQNVLARNVFVHKSLVAVLHWQRWECSTSGGCVAPVVAVWHQWWLCGTSGGYVAPVVAVELSVVSLE